MSNAPCPSCGHTEHATVCTMPLSVEAHPSRYYVAGEPGLIKESGVIFCGCGLCPACDHPRHREKNDNSSGDMPCPVCPSFERCNAEYPSQR